MLLGTPLLWIEGNKVYREIVMLYKPAYLEAKLHKDKAAIVKQVQSHLQEQGFEFVQNAKGTWVEAPPKTVRRKVVQALREGCPELRIHLKAGNLLKNDAPVLDHPKKENETEAIDALTDATIGEGWVSLDTDALVPEGTSDDGVLVEALGNFDTHWLDHIPIWDDAELEASFVDLMSELWDHDAETSTN
ncbi:expressed unknown protein [Seminavis robusta]|uniref:DUF6824 domain-containing protein n=1 Tax=Seminavis robusta TaxID=568900 RepID=A0A9N8DPE5_9STRA|nr:expressed unknown protein [Seminavis robusta]|eukprot:Sro167_g074550.1 n/a (190) ;mRNA; f:71640-72209